MDCKSVGCAVAVVGLSSGGSWLIGSISLVGDDGLLIAYAIWFMLLGCLPCLALNPSLDFPGEAWFCFCSYANVGGWSCSLFLQLFCLTGLLLLGCSLALEVVVTALGLINASCVGCELLNPRDLQKSPVLKLDLLEQLTSTSPSTSGYDTDGSSLNPTIRDQLSHLVGDREGEFSLPLGKKLKASLNSLTISQKRNIRRQAYLDKVSQRNDTRFFAIIAAFVILPPFLLLVVVVLTGYVELLP